MPAHACLGAHDLYRLVFVNLASSLDSAEIDHADHEWKRDHYRFNLGGSERLPLSGRLQRVRRGCFIGNHLRVEHNRLPRSQMLDLGVYRLARSPVCRDFPFTVVLDKDQHLLRASSY